MTLSEAIYDYLASKTGITALVGTRIYRNVLPQGATYPAIVYQRISRSRNPHLLGSSGLTSARVQVTCWSTNPEQAELVADAVRNAWDGFQPGTMGGLQVESVLLEDESQTFDPPIDSSDVGAHGETCDYMIVYQESLPTL